MSASTSISVPLSPDEIDELIYLSRTGDLDGLKELITNLSTAHACSASSILASAIDVDEDGLGSRSSLLHYPAANGNLEIVKYLVGLIGEGYSSAATTAAATSLVNHQNVSGNTPLHWAGMNGHLEVVKVLVGAGADPGLVNAAGRDAVVESECSAKEGAEACADWMLKNCEGLEKGVGGGERGDGDDDDHMLVDGERNGEEDDMKVEGEGEGVGEGEGDGEDEGRHRGEASGVQET